MKKTDRTDYLSKKSYLDLRLQHDVIKEGVACIPCRVRGAEDIISKFSIKGCESLDKGFLDFVMEYIDFIPMEYPITLNIIGPKFSPEEKETIKNTIASEMDYRLGKTEGFLHVQRRRFFSMIAGTVLSGFLLIVAKQILRDVPLEFLYVVFWLFADAFVRYMFIDSLDFREEKRRMGRMTSIDIQFTEDEETEAQNKN